MKVAAIALLLAALLGLGQAFTAPRSAVRVMGVMPRKVAVMQPQGMGAVAQPLPRSAASGTVTMGLFGLGTPELVVIGVIAAAVIGPKNLKKLAGDFGKVAGELKDVPEEFQKGIDEGKKAAIDKAAAGAEPVDVTPPAEAPAKE